MTSVSRVGIVAKSHLRAATPHLAAIASWLEGRGVEAIFESATAALLPTSAPAAGRRVLDKQTLAAQVDLVLVLGGDGTLISMADCIGAAGSNVPILGINFGSLGFLTEVTLPELYPSLEAALSGRARVEDRMMLRAAALRATGASAEHIALNDVVVTKAAHARMIEL
ncbi:MAG: NAD(+)/NADH kinase, partial [Acidobacteria bacterium]|nr:NAD(+)/NADH kinase [Acidobacteriota bacterium]